ncbi:MAG: Holliday junction branch migration protein RuvA [Bdellovibrionales bacterium]|nr:Holliday junction branch migration protein RuvA [Bdellovibrionales bacterium]
MIGRLQGTLVEVDGEVLLLDVNGVGYTVLVTASVLAAGPATGSPLTLVVHTDVRETSITLYGFGTKLERQVFLLLQKVKGIGCRLALGIISAVGAERLLSSIAEGNLVTLTGVPGIGKKTAERIIVELREQVTQLAFGGSVTLSGAVEQSRYDRPKEGAPLEGDAVLALQKLGFSEDKARCAVQEALQGQSVEDVGEVLRLALARM